ncbi:unnamed protein product, partial [marine sediment metagenome]
LQKVIDECEGLIVQAFERLAAGYPTQTETRLVALRDLLNSHPELLPTGTTPPPIPTAKQIRNLELIVSIQKNWIQWLEGIFIKGVMYLTLSFEKEIGSVELTKWLATTGEALAVIRKAKTENPDVFKPEKKGT